MAKHFMWRKCFKHPFHFSYHKRGPSGPISLIWALYTNKCLLLRWSWVKLMKHRVVTRIIYTKYESVTNTVREYGPVKKSQCTSTVTLTFESWPWVQIMTHCLATSNICVKYISVTKTQQENFFFFLSFIVFSLHISHSYKMVFFLEKHIASTWSYCISTFCSHCSPF